MKNNIKVIKKTKKDQKENNHKNKSKEVFSDSSFICDCSSCPRQCG